MSTSDERRRRCCRSSLFKRRNFAIGNVQTFAMYGGLSITFFLLVLYLQEVAGYTALKAGLALTPSTLVMFALSKRVGRLADRLGPRLFMGLGPLTAAVGLALMLRLGAHVNYLTDLLPALLVFSIGLACTVAPLTAAVLSDADESDAGIASGVNNAIARVAGLLAIAAVGAVISAVFISTLDQRLAGVALSPAAERRAHASSQADAYARPSRRLPGVRVDARCPIRIRTRIPRRHRHLGVAHGARRPTRPRGHPQPPTRRTVRGLRRRPARRPATRRCATPGAGAARSEGHGRDVSGLRHAC